MKRKISLKHLIMFVVFVALGLVFSDVIDNLFGFFLVVTIGSGVIGK